MRKHLYIGGLVLLLWSGCQVGPNYRPPQIDLPRQFKNQMTSAQPSRPQSNSTRSIQWFERYQDPILVNLIREGLQSNSDVQIAKARIREARASLLGAEAAFMPSVQATLSQTRGRSSQNSTTGSTGRSYNLYQAGLDSSWELNTWGAFSRGEEAAIAAVESQEEALQDILLSLSAEIAIEYINLRSNQDQLQVSQQSVQNWNEICELNQSLFQAGKTTEIDVNRAQSSRDQIQATLPKLQERIQGSFHRIAVLLGKQPTALYSQLASLRPIPFIPNPTFASLPAQLLKQRPDIRQAERALQSTTAQIGAAKSEWFPHLFLTSQLGFLGNNGGNVFTTASLTGSISPNLSWSILDFGRIRATVMAKEAMRDAQFSTYQKTVLEALEDVENSLVQYSMEQKRLFQLSNAFQASRTAAEMSFERYKSGLMNYIDVSTAALAWHNDHIAMLQSQATVSINSITLYKALGGGF
jgi:NodT family efflux transporter outer membrane factor (OMF) lipoprotein